MANQADAEERELEQDLPVDDADPGDEDQALADDADDDQTDDDGEQPEDEEEVEITFGDEAAPASRGEDSVPIRELRKRIREQAEELHRLRSGQAEPQQIEVGEKPTLESCEYDEAKFEQELDAWKDRKAQAEARQTEAEKRNQAVTARFAEKVSNFQTAKAAFKVKDFDAAEDLVGSTLAPVQQAVVIKAAENPANVIYALGRHPAKLTALSAIEDPIELAAAVARLEGTLKVTTKRRAAAEPDQAVRGSAPTAVGEDKVLARLEAKAARTGDRTEVLAYKRQLKDKADKR